MATNEKKKFHDIFNALAIAKGYTEVIQSSLVGDFELTEDDRKEKLSKAVKAMERAEDLLNELKILVLKNEME